MARIYGEGSCALSEEWKPCIRGDTNLLEGDWLQKFCSLTGVMPLRVLASLTPTYLRPYN